MKKIKKDKPAVLSPLTNERIPSNEPNKERKHQKSIRKW